MWLAPKGTLDDAAASKMEGGQGQGCRLQAFESRVVVGTREGENWLGGERAGRALRDEGPYSTAAGVTIALSGSATCVGCVAAAFALVTCKSVDRVVTKHG